MNTESNVFESIAKDTNSKIITLRYPDNSMQWVAEGEVECPECSYTGFFGSISIKEIIDLIEEHNKTKHATEVPPTNTRHNTLNVPPNDDRIIRQ